MTQLEVIKASVHRGQRIGQVLHTADIHKAGQLTNGVGKAGFLHPLNHLVGLNLFLFKLRRNFCCICTCAFRSKLRPHVGGQTGTEHRISDADYICKGAGVHWPHVEELPHVVDEPSEQRLFGNPFGLHQELLEAGVGHCIGNKLTGVAKDVGDH